MRWFRSRDQLKPYGSCLDTRVYEALGEAGKMLVVKEVAVRAPFAPSGFVVA